MLVFPAELVEAVSAAGEGAAGGGVMAEGPDVADDVDAVNGSEVSAGGAGAAGPDGWSRPLASPSDNRPDKACSMVGGDDEGKIIMPREGKKEKDTRGVVRSERGGREGSQTSAGRAE